MPLANPTPSDSQRRSGWIGGQERGGDQGPPEEHGPLEEHREGAERRHQPRHQGAGEDDQPAGHAAEEEGGVHEEDPGAGLAATGGLREVPDPHTQTGAHPHSLTDTLTQTHSPSKRCSPSLPHRLTHSDSLSLKQVLTLTHSHTHSQTHSPTRPLF